MIERERWGAQTIPFRARNKTLMASLPQQLQGIQPPILVHFSLFNL